MITTHEQTFLAYEPGNLTRSPEKHPTYGER